MAKETTESKFIYAPESTLKKQLTIEDNIEKLTEKIDKHFETLNRLLEELVEQNRGRYYE